MPSAENLAGKETGMDLLAFFAPGWMELLVIAITVLVLAAPIVAAVVIVLALSKKGKSGAAANPNLYPCPDCGHFVSRHAPTCPQCGRPLTPQEES